MEAFAPGSITGLFAPGRNGNPSLGISFAIADGVTARVVPAETTTIVRDGAKISMAPVENVLQSLGVSATVELVTDIPLGHGFGASGAATLAAAIAANKACSCGLDRDVILTLAHEAEVAAGTGQGDVFIQDRGGLIWDIGAGVNRRELNQTVEYATAGGIETTSLLSDDDFLALADTHGRDHLSRLPNPPTISAVASLSQSYIHTLDLVTEFVETQLTRVSEAGGIGGMALFGETVFAVKTTNVLPHSSHVDNRGARII